MPAQTRQFNGASGGSIVILTWFSAGPSRPMRHDHENPNARFNPRAGIQIHWFRSVFDPKRRPNGASFIAHRPCFEVAPESIKV
jgi:hypothetical protein